MLKVLYKIISFISSIYIVVVFYVGGFAIHLYTSYIVYASYGLFLGIIAFFSPAVSEIIMFILFLIFYGLFNEYCIILLIYLLLVALVFLSAPLIDQLKTKANNK